VRDTPIYPVQTRTNSCLEATKNKIIKWLAPVDPRTNQEAARKKHEEQTGRWFTEGEQFSKWLEQPNSLLWLHGIPGSGKTILWYCISLHLFKI
jgi:DNA replication protein DnaC